MSSSTGGTGPRLSRSLLISVGLLYAASGLPFGIVHELVPTWLAVEGSSLEELGLVTLVGLPWTLKLLWAPLVDRLSTSARWIAGALVGVAAAVALTPHLSGPALMAVLVAIAFFSATQDIAIDGHTAAVTPDDQHGRVNGLRVAAYRAAMLLGGGGAVALGDVLPWPVIFGGLGVLALGMAAWASRLPPAPREPTSLLEWTVGLKSWLLRRDSLAVFAFVLLFKLGDSAMYPMIKPFWLDSGMSVTELGLVSITIGTALSVTGALVGGELTTRMGLFRGLWVLGGVQALSNLGYAAAAMAPSRWSLYGASMVESFCGGLGTAAFLACLMRLCEGEQTATRFAALTAFVGLTRTLSGAASGYGASAFGYSTYFAFTFLLALPAFLLLPAARRRLGAA